MITVGIDGRALLGEPTGVGRYLRNLVREALDVAPDLRLRIFLDREGDDGLGEHARLDRARLRGSRGRNVVAWTQWSLPGMIRAGGVSLFHFPFYTMPLLGSCPSIVTIHDITFSLHPEWFPWRARLSFSAFAPRSARRARRVLTVSECSRRDIARTYGIPPSKVTAVPLAADPVFRPAPPERVAAARSKLGLEGPYLIHLGSLHPRRNLERLLDAFASAAAGRDLKLVLAGRIEAPLDSVAPMIARRSLEGRAIHLGYVPEEALPGLIAGAEALVYPSLYEGFGLPVLEAMACGTPVITSNVSALPETAGDAALLVDPLSTEEIAAAIRRLVDEPPLREALRQRGLERAAEFSWRRTAAATVAVYRSALPAGGAAGGEAAG